MPRSARPAVAWRRSTGCSTRPRCKIQTSSSGSGGDRRLSNGFLWQSAYSELLFLDQLWPDFTREHLENALVEFGKRVRTLGTSHREQSASTPDAQAEPGP
ncbi:undecaprenyl diphosphate synthase family protein [Mycobacterium marinum]|uniref:undecaprenyl diphosphate synthase family protein n=1 Tax=Mycobacterium marinum TaxID=1781 RepID=UPI00234171F0|nr:undecaprenyl diphosphate synthase family protein [Mycobacterium marinum]MDC8996637.1 undecaprenyl diphosphate synthase family protein [Mycobacterium marinum]WDZ16307.1 undecaprenyl diphosphate synthase family protein [Mycobacterium marinum]